MGISNVGGGGGGPAQVFRGTYSGALPGGTGVQLPQKVALATIATDVLGGWDAVNHRFNPPKAGWYLAIAQATTASGSDPSMDVAVYKNGAIVDETEATLPTFNETANPAKFNGAPCLVQMNGTTDYLEPWASAGFLASPSGNVALTAVYLGA